MAELLVIGYADDETANKALETVHELEQDLIMETGGAAVVHKTDDGKVEMVTKTGATSSGVAMGGFWGMLFGLLFLVPVGGWIVELFPLVVGRRHHPITVKNYRANRHFVLCLCLLRL